MAQKAIIIALPQQGGKTVMLRAFQNVPPTVVPQPALEVDVESMDEGLDEDEACSPRKRSKLTHLTPEEKLSRRKLRNRIAAQSARDRKKEQFATMEARLGEVEAENKRLRLENEKLRTILKAKRTFVVQTTAAPDGVKKDKPVIAATEKRCNNVEVQTESAAAAAPNAGQTVESAALSSSAPQQQGQAWSAAGARPRGGAAATLQVLAALWLSLASTPSWTGSKGSPALPPVPPMLSEQNVDRISRLNLKPSDKERLYRVLSQITTLHTRKVPYKPEPENLSA